MKLAVFHSLGLAMLISTGAVVVQVEQVETVDGRMTYSHFAQTVEHADLAVCPSGVDPETQFCRRTVAAERGHVFVFDLEGDQVLWAIRSNDLAGGRPAF
ncbi:hypothetical protein RA2_00638 [Roseovarius sp. A-2]|uniref:hypothetical protein n=1 Tax=Roseovarius sp. A-2 TaxID=1570360 RepID=UPI0009D1E50D|nr:hypothetical protein [Roseovarius sp. A-2]GAW33598.1 hypothetical protein RA2_00638 [Roseovarius sp. A-2]